MAGFTRQRTTEDVAELARERMADCFRRFDRVVVWFSGGKDSTVVLDLAYEVARSMGRLPLEAVHWDEEAIHPETVEYVQRVSERDGISLRWFCYPVKHRNACSREEPWWYPWAPEDEAKWCRPLPAKAITALPRTPSERLPIPQLNGHVLGDRACSTIILTGIRAQESLRRLRIVMMKEHDNWLSQDPHAPHVMIAKPIYDWTTEDVWTAPRLFGWDYNRAYDVMTLAGVSRHGQRVCPPYGEEPLQGLWRYAECWPHLWEKMIARVPGAATAGRYSRSPLYGFGDRRKEPPVGMTWQQAVQASIMKWPEDQRPLVAARIRQEITAHEGRTGGAPIKGHVSGAEELSWSFLLMLAERGDFKGRRTMAFKQTEEEGTTRYE